MQVRYRPDIEAEIRPRMDRIDKMTRALGCQSDPHRALLLGVSTRTITRARNGQAISNAFIANVLVAAKRYKHQLAQSGLKFRPTFSELFEVVSLREEVGDVRPAA